MHDCQPTTFDTRYRPDRQSQAWWIAAAAVPDSNPPKAACPVVRFQNMPSRKVANNGALTKAKTNCRKSMMLLKWVAPTVVVDRKGDPENRRHSPHPKIMLIAGVLVKIIVTKGRR